MDDQFAADLLLTVFLPLAVMLGVLLLFWALPVYLGVRWARAKGYSPLWMLFGLHPVGAWIAAAVMGSLPARAQCLNCRAFVREDFALCPYCGYRGGENPFAEVPHQTPLAS